MTDERGQDRSAASVRPTEEGPALRDAEAAARRIDADERAAEDARERHRTEPLPTLEPDDRVRPMLRQDEVVHTTRASAILKAPGDDRALGYGGTLYLTSQRLLHLGQVTVNVQLIDILETTIAGERLLITLREGEGISLDLDRPRLLRTEIAIAQRSRQP